MSVDDHDPESYDLADHGDDRVGLEDLADDSDAADADEFYGDDEPSDEAEDEFDELDDATDEEIDFVVAMYREDGLPVATAMASELANDLDELILQLSRLPGDAGASAILSIASEFFVICRVRGRNVQVVLSDSYAANDWPIARDIADYLGIDAPEDDEESGPIGDLGIFADQGLSEFDLEQICGDLDEDSDELATRIAERIRFGAQFHKVVDAID